jgi:flavin reductase (DIM6/NTAB) family NADH-FMN oxidoreductase RutF
MTLSSFNSLSLDPPLVLFSIDGRAASLRSWAKADGYALNVLAEGQRELSERFAKPHSKKWEETTYATGLFGAPVLSGIAALFECAAESTMEAGDHVLFIGAVKRFCLFTDCLPLVFHGGEYSRLRRLEYSREGQQASASCMRNQGARVRQGRNDVVEDTEERCVCSV